jgi:hypothetical protein
MPRKNRGRGSRKRIATESVTENIQPNERASARSAKVKRRGKSSPLDAQAARHDKPHAVQDTTEEGQPVRKSSGIVASRQAVTVVYDPEVAWWAFGVSRTR